jgi:hypothetical protein
MEMIITQRQLLNLLRKKHKLSKKIRIFRVEQNWQRDVGYWWDIEFIHNKKKGLWK